MSAELKAAVIYRSWWQSFRSVLSDTERLQIYDHICSYSFEGISPDTAELSPALRVTWSMIVPYLDEDKRKYEERCSRNRANASRKPLAASGSESLSSPAIPKAAAETKKTTKTTTISFSDEQREKFLVACCFISRGAIEWKSELERFWNYYSALGWRGNKGGVIVNKVAAARMWSFKCETYGSIETASIVMKALSTRGVPEWEFLRQLGDITFHDDCILVKCRISEDRARTLMAELDPFMAAALKGTDYKTYSIIIPN